LRRPSLRPQLNQVRLWVRQGRTDAWIAHKLDVSVEQLNRFKREHRLDAEPPPAAAPELPAELDFGDGREEAGEGSQAELEPTESTEAEEAGSAPAEAAEEEELETADVEDAAPAQDELEEDAEAPRRRRRGRRGGRRRTARQSTYEATFDHGGEGYGLWLDPAVADDPVYDEHWAGHRAVIATVAPDAITIRRTNS
jgi:hypothetical protein